MAFRQAPNNQGVRKTRLGIIRASYPNLRSTTVKTVEDWMPRECGSITQTAPMTGFYRIPLPDGTVAEIELIFIAVETEADVDKLRSLEVSQFWINEASEVAEAVLQIAISRVGRFPSAKDGAGCTYPGVLIDFNLVDEAHFLHRWCVTEKPDNLEYFEQPPAMICTNFEAADAGDEEPVLEVNPHAENLRNLPAGYYDNMRKAFSWNQVKAFLLMKWVSSAKGKLVFSRDFRRSAHVGKVRTKPIITEVVTLGIDTSGLHPGGVALQPQAGSLVVMDEFYGEDVAFEQFVTEILLPLLAARYHGCEVIAVCDPSNPKDARTGVTPVQLLQKYGIRAVVASTNKFALRREAVSRLLNKRDGLVIDPACKTLIRAFEESYVFKKLKGTSTSGGQLYSTEAEKNEVSHVMDGLQYGSLGFARVADNDMSRGRLPRVTGRRVM